MGETQRFKFSQGPNLLYTFGTERCAGWDIEHILSARFFWGEGTILYPLVLRIGGTTYIEFGKETGSYWHSQRTF